MWRAKEAGAERLCAESGMFSLVRGSDFRFNRLCLARHSDRRCESKGDHGKCAPHVGQILVTLVISFPQWQMNVRVSMRLPTMKSGMPTIAPTTVQQSTRPIT